MSFAMCLDAFELVGSILVTEKQVQIQILKSKIKGIVSEHKQQFKTISEIHTILSNFYSDPILIQNTYQTSFVLHSSWNNIASDLNQKIQLINQLTTSQSNQNTSAYDFTFTDGFILSVGSLLTVYQLYSFQKKYGSSSGKQISPQNLGQQLRDTLGRQHIKMVQLNGPESVPTEPNEKVIQMQTSFTTPREDIQGVKQFSVSSSKIQTALQAPSKSLWTKLKTFGSKLGKGLMKGLRIIGVLALIYMFVMQQKQIEKMYTEYQNLIDQYGQDGKFKDKEINIINLILSFGELVSNLSYATFGCFQQISNLFMMMSLVQSQSNALLLMKSEQIYPKFYPFCQASSNLFKSLAEIKVTNQSSYQDLRIALNKSCTLLQEFFKNQKPVQTFQGYSLKLNNFLIVDLFFVKKLLIYQTNVRNFQIKQKNEFLEREKTISQMKAEKQTQEQITKLDQEFIVEFVKSYIKLKQKMELKTPEDSISVYSDLFKINPSFRGQIGNVFASFTKVVYAETGNKLFGKPFQQYQGSSSYRDIIDNSFNYPNMIRIPFSQNEQRQEFITRNQIEIYKYISQGRIPNYFNGAKYRILEKIPAMIYTVLVDYLQINSKSYNKMKFVKALLYKIQIIEEKHIQQIIFKNDDGNISLQVV